MKSQFLTTLPGWLVLMQINRPAPLLSWEMAATESRGTDGQQPPHILLQPRRPAAGLTGRVYPRLPAEYSRQKNASPSGRKTTYDSGSRTSKESLSRESVGKGRCFRAAQLRQARLEETFLASLFPRGAGGFLRQPATVGIDTPREKQCNE